MIHDTTATAACRADGTRCGPLPPPFLLPVGAVPVQGDVRELGDISATARVGSFLVLGSDEAAGPDGLTSLLRFFTGDPSTGYRINHLVPLETGSERSPEVDLEALAAEGHVLYALGSHSRRRPRVKPSLPRAENHKRLKRKAIEKEKLRRRLFRLTLALDGTVVGKEQVSLARILRDDPVLQAFARLPSKENGIDIEALAARDGHLWLGFRGPVLRGNFVPVMVLAFDRPKDYALRFVRLGGRGIRSMAAVSDGFLILAGPVGDGEDGYRLVHWDGDCMVPGNDVTPGEVGKARTLGAIPIPPGGKAEGLEVLADGPDGWRLLIAYDGARSPEDILWAFDVPRPSGPAPHG